MEATLSYPLGMTDKKNPGGRPARGSRYPRRLMIYETDRGMDLLQALADLWDTTQADVVRRLVREKAAELGVQASSAEGAADDAPKA